MEAHGEFKLAPSFKINTLGTLITGKAKEYFDLWEADHDPTSAKQIYEELLNKVKDYAKGYASWTPTESFSSKNRVNF